MAESTRLTGSSKKLNKRIHKKSWDIIIYTNDNTCSHVPSSWAVNKEKSCYLWPANVKGSKINKLLDDCLPPDGNSKVSFSEFPAVCKTTVFCLEYAKECAKKLLANSSLSSPDELALVLRSFSNQTSLIVDKSDDDVSEQSENSNVTYDSSKNEEISDFTCIPEDQESTAEEPAIVVNPNMGRLEVIISGIQDTLRDIQYEIRKIRQQTDSIEVCLKTLTSINPSAEAGATSNFAFHLPAACEDDLKIIEERAGTQEGFEQLVKILTFLGGESVNNKSVALILKKIMNKEISLTYSALGRKGKKNFSELRLYKAVVEAVKSRFPEAMEVEIRKQVGVTLATAGDRNGERSSRKPKQAMLTDKVYSE